MNIPKNTPMAEMMAAEIGRLRAINADLIAALAAATHALRSYQYGNSATDLAEEVADNAETAIAKATKERP